MYSLVQDPCTSLASAHGPVRHSDDLCSSACPSPSLRHGSVRALLAKPVSASRYSPILYFSHRCLG